MRRWMQVVFYNRIPSDTPSLKTFRRDFSLVNFGPADTCETLACFKFHDYALREDTWLPNRLELYIRSGALDLMETFDQLHAAPGLKDEDRTKLLGTRENLLLMGVSGSLRILCYEYFGDLEKGRTLKEERNRVLSKGMRDQLIRDADAFMRRKDRADYDPASLKKMFPEFKVTLVPSVNGTG